MLAAGAELTEDSLQRFLTEHLSWNRMPKRILIVDSIPKGPTGKIQRIGLAERLGVESVHPATEPVPADDSDPDADVVTRLLELWRDVLRNPDVDADTRFLDAGGDSVTAAALAVRVGQDFGVDVPLLDFFSASSVSRHAALIAPLLATGGD